MELRHHINDSLRLGWLALALNLLVLPLCSVAAEKGGRVEYVGGTVASLPAQTKGSIHTTDETSFVFRSKEITIEIPYRKINLLEYGQKANRRYLMGILISPVLLLSKSRQHYLTVGYVDEEGNQQAAVLKIHKDDVRAALVSLEVKTGLEVQYQDAEARKAGKD